MIELQRALTDLYRELGFINSGAVLPSDPFHEGVLTLQIIEGRITDIDVVTENGYSPEVVRRALSGLTKGVANVHDVERSLQLLQSDHQILRVTASLEAGDSLGETTLRVRIEEAPKWQITAQAGNDISPSIGEWRGLINIERERLLGIGDRFKAMAWKSKGATQVEGVVEIPLRPFRTTLRAHGRGSWSEVVEKPFDELELETTVMSFGASIVQNVAPGPKHRVSFSLLGEWRRGQTLIDGAPFQFPDATGDGSTTLSVLRLGSDWNWRARSTSFAARATFSLGLTLDAGQGGPLAEPPDEGAFAWFVQTQLARRLPWLDSRLVLRGDTQLTPFELPGLERIGVGGRWTVRGYRENAIVSNNAVIGALEWHAPLPFARRWAQVDLIGFFDAARAWNAWGRDEASVRLTSAGAGMRAVLGSQLIVDFSWGKAIDALAKAPEPSLSERGFHMIFTWQPPIP